MPIRCKLISPTNLLLEHPMFNPVKETEFVVFGMKEWEKERQDSLLNGMLIGAFACAVICTLAIVLAIGYRRDHHTGNGFITPIPAICRHLGARSGEGWPSNAR
jgi:hypothetical protein